MKVAVTELFNLPPEIIFAALTDIAHHTDWLEEVVELIGLRDGPAKLGTQWEHHANRLGKKLVMRNTCNLYEMNRKFGWKTEKPFPAQITILLESQSDITKLTWVVEAEEVGIVRLIEPLLVRQTNELIQKSLIGLKAYLQALA